MDTQCYVDGDVVDWNAGDDDEVGSDIAALVVFHPKMSCRIFDVASDQLEERQEARAALTISLAQDNNRPFGLIDTNLMLRVDEAMTDCFGANFLESFLSDTRMVAMTVLGDAFNRIEAMGVRITPATVLAAVDICPARSFKSEKAIASYLRDGKATWKPAIRLALKVSLDGPLLDVEAGGYILRSTISEKWPITEWRQKVRSTEIAKETASSLRIVTG